MYNRGLKYNTIAAAKSVLSGIIHILGVSAISEHPLVIRLMKGVFNSRPPESRYHYIWDASQVICYLASLNNEISDFRTLSLKLVTLFTLLLGQRVSTLHKFKLSCLQILPGRVVFHIDELLKQTRPTHPPKPIIFRAFVTAPQLCPVATFHSYSSARATIVGDKYDRFFICHRKPNGPATVDTLARWVKQVMTAAGVDTDIFCPHSCRSASSSKARNTGVPLQKVLAAGQWFTDSVFYRFYEKQIISHPLTNEEYAEAILR